MSTTNVHIESPGMLKYFITEQGGRLINVLQNIAPNKDLDILLTNTLKVMIQLVLSRKPNIPPEQDFFILSSRTPAELQGRFFTKTRREDSVGEFEIPMPKEFFERLATLRELVTYESEESAVRHIFLFAFYSQKEKVGIGRVH